MILAGTCESLCSAHLAISNVHSGQKICETIVQWSLSETTTCGPVLTDFNKEVTALQRYI